LKNNGIPVVVLCVPYGAIVDPNAGFANNEAGYANTNVTDGAFAANLLLRMLSDIPNARVTMFEQGANTAQISH
jgi:hypothetical protein